MTANELIALAAAVFACGYIIGALFCKAARQRRKNASLAAYALDDILITARRVVKHPPAPPPPCAHRFRFKGIGTRQGWRGAPPGHHAGYECVHCKKLYIVRAHRAAVQRDYVKPENRSPLK